MISNLITDRTQADVAYLRTQRERILNEGWSALSEAEQMEYLAGLKGGYNATDLNRVTHAMEYLVERIRSYGYTVKYEKVKVPHQPQKGKSRLPAGYTELEYIESTGTQRINTGVKPDQDTRVIVDFEIDTSVTSELHICSVRSSSGGAPFYTLYYSGSAWGTRYGTQALKTSTSITTKARHLFDKNKNVTTIDNTETITATYESFSSDTELPLFCRADGTTYNAYIKGKLYSCKIYDNGTLIRDFVPCKNPNGEAGLYDFINKSFVGNSGSGEFLAGGEIIPRQLPEGYTQVTYIQSSGTQYIDTGFKPNNDTRVVMDFEITETHTINVVLFGTRASTTSQNYTLMYHSSNKYFRSDYNTNSTGSPQSWSLEALERYTFDKNKETTTISGMSKSYTNAAFTCKYNLILLALNSAGSISNSPAGKLYSCKIYDNGTLIRDFVPCSNPSGSIGLYDITNDVFYANSGTGVFTAGAEVELAPAEILDDYTWYHSDIPQTNELNAYLQNVRWLRESMALLPNTPEVPYDMEGLTFAEANDIEMILVNIETIINLMVASFIYSGEIFSGEVI